MCTPNAKETTAALRFVGIDPDTPEGTCPSVWRDDNGDFLFQGWEETDAANIATIADRSPILPHERIVRLPARMLSIIRQATEA